MNAGTTSVSEENWDYFWKQRRRTLLGRLLFWVRVNFLARRFVDIAERNSSKGKVLEAGCGTSLSSILLAHQRGDRLVLMDISSEALEMSERLAAEYEVDAQVLKRDIGSIPFDDKHFDLAWNIGTIEHFPDPAPIVKEMKRASKTTICIVPAAGIAWWLFESIIERLKQCREDYCKLYNADELQALFEDCGYDNVDLVELRALLVFPYLAAIGRDD
jgi:SAM-dependent methyltransferase